MWKNKKFNLLFSEAVLPLIYSRVLNDSTGRLISIGRKKSVEID